jgi:short-subunit dehydrogenase
MNAKLKNFFNKKSTENNCCHWCIKWYWFNGFKIPAQAGAHVLLLARTKEKLDEVKAEIEAKGGKASVFPCDLNDMESIDAVSKEILAAVDHIDILINNAGRSIRRAVHESVDRFHDFERTMQLNYFGAVRLVLMSCHT